MRGASPFFTPGNWKNRSNPTSGTLKKLEALIDEYNDELPPLKEFILPGGNEESAYCHLARAVCRRAERKFVKLGQSENVNQHSQCYLNRLSDLLFVFARILPENKAVFNRFDGLAFSPDGHEIFAVIGKNRILSFVGRIFEVIFQGAYRQRGFVGVIGNERTPAGDLDL